MSYTWKYRPIGTDGREADGSGTNSKRITNLVSRFRFWLRIADSLGQHLAKLSLGLRRLPRIRLSPCGHGHYVGMAEGE